MSWQLTILNAVLRHVGRPLLKRTKSPARARRDFELTSRVFFRGPRKPFEPIELGGVPARVMFGGRDQTGPMLLYFHGGGYITGSSASYGPLVGRLCRLSGLPAVVPDYRLVPDFPFPAAFEDAVAVWNALRERGVAASDIVIGGDSAGGGLALALLGALLEEGERPAGAFAFSPWTDLTLSGASFVENSDRDNILPSERASDACDMIAPRDDRGDPRLSPLFARFEGGPPVYLQASRSEILRDDTTRLAGKMADEGVDVRTDLWDHTPHVWQLFAGWVPEADDALAKTASFVRECLTELDRPSGS